MCTWTKRECYLTVLYTSTVIGTELLALGFSPMQWAPGLVHNCVLLGRKCGNNGVSMKGSDAFRQSISMLILLGQRCIKVNGGELDVAGAAAGKHSEYHSVPSGGFVFCVLCIPKQMCAWPILFFFPVSPQSGRC